MPPIPVSLKREAMHQYLIGGTAREIAEKLGLKMQTVQVWATKEQWGVERNRMQDEAEEIIFAECRDLILANKKKVMLADLTVSDQLGEAIQKNLVTSDGTVRNVTPRDLDSLAKAAKNSSDIATRIVGLAEGGVGGPSMTVNIGIAGQMTDHMERSASVVEG